MLSRPSLSFQTRRSTSLHHDIDSALIQTNRSVHNISAGGRRSVLSVAVCGDLLRRLEDMKPTMSAIRSACHSSHHPANEILTICM